MKSIIKVSSVVLGYVAAWLLADWATARFDARLTAGDPANASGGMAAFGVMVFFLQAFAVLAMFPTALGLWCLRTVPAVWERGGRWSRYLAATGVLALLLFVPILQLNRSLTLARNEWLTLAFLLVGVRLVGALVCGALDALCALFSPSSEPRRQFLQAFLVEAVVFVLGFALFLWWPRT